MPVYFPKPMAMETEEVHASQSSRMKIFTYDYKFHNVAAHVHKKRPKKDTSKGILGEVHQYP